MCVNLMSEKRTPISIYLTPRASAILREYSVGSGYGSLSRTVEEIILAFDFVYNTVESMKYSFARMKKPFTNDDKISLFVGLYTVLVNIGNAISRLSKETQPNIP